MSAKIRPITLIVLDGWGYSSKVKHNAIAQANTPNWDAWWQKYPHCLLEGSGSCVGLPDGQMGNSEVGHMHIGAGRVINQDFTRINSSIKTGEFFQNDVLLEAVQHCQQSQTRLHVFGLLSPGGVHSHEDHILALAQLAAQNDLNDIHLHAFLDGRDTPPKSAQASLEKLQNDISIASICGRYYAMDRDKRWDRIEQAYTMMVNGKTKHHADNAVAGLTAAYDRGETDEFVLPTLIYKEFAVTINHNDTIIFMNFRSDRARQLTETFIDANFDGFARNSAPKLHKFISLTTYDKNYPITVAFPPSSMENVIGEFVADQKLYQLRIAETEKYAHVTFFMNGGYEEPFANEDRTLIPSPKVATYDLQPEMSAPELTQKLVTAIKSEKYDLIICNYANPDMVGHTGDFMATMQAIECVDACLGQVIAALQATGGEAIITADHGNAENMYNDATQQAHTAHTSLPVPMLYIGRPATVTTQQGALTDIAPTLLSLMGLTPPNEMTGQCLLDVTDE